jgi:hypothetical protein
VQVSVVTAGMAVGLYQVTIAIEAESWMQDSQVHLPMKRTVTREIQQCYLPLTLRGHRP